VIRASYITRATDQPSSLLISMRQHVLSGIRYHVQIRNRKHGAPPCQMTLVLCSSWTPNPELCIDIGDGLRRRVAGAYSLEKNGFHMLLRGGSGDSLLPARGSLPHDST